MGPRWAFAKKENLVKAAMWEKIAFAQAEQSLGSGQEIIEIEKERT